MSNIFTFAPARGQKCEQSGLIALFLFIAATSKISANDLSWQNNTELKAMVKALSTMTLDESK